MVPGDKVLKGEGKSWIFMTFLGGSKIGKNMKIQDGHGPKGKGFEGGGESLDFHDFFGGS